MSYVPLLCHKKLPDHTRIDSIVPSPKADIATFERNYSANVQGRCRIQSWRQTGNIVKGDTRKSPGIAVFKVRKEQTVKMDSWPLLMAQVECKISSFRQVASLRGCSDRLPREVPQKSTAKTSQ
jgi:hypothetical protein